MSGGCIETDVFARAMQVLDDGRPVVQRYGIDDDVGVAVGLSCGGEIDVLIEPFRDDPVWSAVRTAARGGEPVALCVAITPERWLGRRLAVHADGRMAGGIAPELDARLRDDPVELLRDLPPRILEVGAGERAARIFVQAVAPPPRLFVVGATHIAIPLCRMAGELGFDVTVIDPRAPFATPERFPAVDRLVVDWPDGALDAAGLDERCHVVTLSHDFKFDVPSLERALRANVAYVGALGGRRTHERRLARLRELGFDAAALARIHTPIGLDIGARTPEEIAIAILAELIAVRRGHAGGSLSRRSGRVHAPQEDGHG